MAVTDPPPAQQTEDQQPTDEQVQPPRPPQQAGESGEVKPSHEASPLAGLLKFTIDLLTSLTRVPRRGSRPRAQALIGR
jgi:hypothetical protein